MQHEKLWQIQAPHFCAGVVVVDGVIVDAAPILKWAKGWRWKDFRQYAIRKGWHGLPCG